MLKEGITTGGLLLIIFTLFGLLQSKVKKLERDKEDKAMCNEKHSATSLALNKGDMKFVKMIETQTQMSICLGRIDERLTSVSKQLEQVNRELMRKRQAYRITDGPISNGE